RVVVADDDATITALVKAAFQNYAFECHIARDGGQALELTRVLQPDALVLDVNMPQFDGFEVLHALKNDPATARVAVVLLSARQPGCTHNCRSASRKTATTSSGSDGWPDGCRNIRRRSTPTITRSHARREMSRHSLDGRPC